MNWTYYIGDTDKQFIAHVRIHLPFKNIYKTFTIWKQTNKKQKKERRLCIHADSQTFLWSYEKLPSNVM